MKTKVLVLDALVGATGVQEIENIKGVLAEQSDQFLFQVVDLYDHELAKNQIESADKIIISGSPQAVYETKELMKKLEFAYSVILSGEKPTLAICFGAQFLAQILGARVSKNPQGIEFGSISLSLTDAGQEHELLQDFHVQKKVHATHGDYIETLPNNTQLLAYNDNSPIQAYQYGNVLATQFHPDVPVRRMQELLESRKEKYLATGVVSDEDAFVRIHQDLDSGAAGHTILQDFLII